MRFWLTADEENQGNQWDRVNQSKLVAANLHLSVGPAGDLDNHVEDGLLRVGVQWDIVEGRDGHAVLLDVHPVLQGVGSGHPVDVVGRRHRACRIPNLVVRSRT